MTQHFQVPGQDRSRSGMVRQMLKQTLRKFFVLAVIFTIGGSAPGQTGSAPRTRSTGTRSAAQGGQATYRYAWQYGYRAGYDDGYSTGRQDFAESSPRGYEDNQLYIDANRTYRETMGTLAEFRESYRVGFELGYQDGYYGRPVTTAFPANLGRIVIATLNTGVANAGVASATEVVPPEASTPRRRRSSLLIPDNLEMKIRLTTSIDTRTSRVADRFSAVVLDPSGYADAVIEGHIAALKKSGKATGKTELSLTFDTISLRDGRSGRMAGQVVRIYESESVKTIDEEGNVQSGSRTRDTATRTAGGGAVGAIIGGIAGGAKGAAIGAIIGAGAGVGSVLIQNGKSLLLSAGTEMLIRTAAPERINDGSER
jgi:hypothetical protein